MTRLTPPPPPPRVILPAPKPDRSGWATILVVVVAGLAALAVGLLAPRGINNAAAPPAACVAAVEAYDALHEMTRDSVDGLASAAAAGEDPVRVAATLDELAARLDVPALADLRDECRAGAR